MYSCHSKHFQVCPHAQGSDHALRYLSLHDNKFLRYFQGHSLRVTSVCMSPKSDLFLSAGLVSQPYTHQLN